MNLVYVGKVGKESFRGQKWVKGFHYFDGLNMLAGTIMSRSHHHREHARLVEDPARYQHPQYKYKGSVWDEDILGILE